MLTRKRKNENNNKGTKKTLEKPTVNTIKDLINISEGSKIYKNLDMHMLWRITPYLKELDNMIGLESVKKTILYQILYYLQGMYIQNNNEYLHTVIYGPPGSGKTTIAKILGNIYHEMGILNSDLQTAFKIAYREDLIAGYLGQTSIKTKKLLTSCIGGVLFIDEVYSLGPKDGDRDSFSKEAIDTITSFLSEHKNDFCCIIAGYEDKINECFFGQNTGLLRRFPWVHRIEPYRPEELYEIFLHMIQKDNWGIDADKQDIIRILHDNNDIFKYGGGDIETFLTKCKIVHSHRVFGLPQNQKFILTKKDIDNAILMAKSSIKIKEKGPPEHMYM